MKPCVKDNAPDEIHAIREQLQDALRSGITMTRIAVEAGIRRDTINRILDVSPEDWPNLLDMSMDRLRDWLGRSSTVARVAPDPDWVETPTAKAIMEALWFAAEQPSMAIVYGGAGVGKTTTLRQFQKRRPNTWIVTADDFSRTPVAILKRVAEAIDYRDGGRRADDIMTDILYKMRDSADRSGTGGLLVIDEAQHLTPRALEGLRSIHDQAGVGLALAGNEKVFARMKGGAQAANFAQIYSRVGRRLHLPQPTEHDVDAVLEAWGISGIKERDYAQRIAALPGGLRHMVQMIRQAKSMAEAAGSAEINVRHLKAAARSLGIEQ